jgi:hypothetical protein
MAASLALACGAVAFREGGEVTVERIHIFVEFGYAVLVPAVLAIIELCHGSSDASMM